MKTITLQEKYNRDKMNVILENIDANEIRQIAQVFKQINQVVGDANLPTIKRIVAQAGQEIADLQSKGFFKQLLGAITLNIGQKRVMSSIVTLQTQLVSMFQSLPDMMSIAGSVIEKGLTTPTAGGVTFQSAISNMDGESGGQAIQNLEKMMTKALEPDIIQGLFSKYELDPKTITKEILNLDINDFRSLVTRASGVKLQVPVGKEDLEDLKDSEKEGDLDAGTIFSKLTPDQIQTHITVISFLEKLGQEIDPKIKKGLATQMRKSTEKE
jgi:thiol-disulfide isomerase/thioredoxin